MGYHGTVNNWMGLQKDIMRLQKDFMGLKKIARDDIENTWD